jgi:hypothetical protein
MMITPFKHEIIVAALRAQAMASEDAGKAAALQNKTAEAAQLVAFGKACAAIAQEFVDANPRASAEARRTIVMPRKH